MEDLIILSLAGALIFGNAGFLMEDNSYKRMGKFSFITGALLFIVFLGVASTPGDPIDPYRYLSR